MTISKAELIAENCLRLTFSKTILLGVRLAAIFNGKLKEQISKSWQELNKVIETAEPKPSEEEIQQQYNAFNDEWLSKFKKFDYDLIKAIDNEEITVPYFIEEKPNPLKVNIQTIMSFFNENELIKL